MKIRYLSLLFLSVASLQAITLNEAYDMLLQNSPDLKEMEYKYKASRYGIEKEESKNNIELSWNAKRSTYKDKKGLNRDRTDNNSYALSLRKSIYNKNNDFDIVKSELLHKKDKVNLDEKKQKLLLDLSTKYFDVIKYQSEKKLILKKLSLSQTRLNQIEKKLNFGLSSKVDYYQAKVNLHETKNQLQDVNKKFSVAKNNLDDFLMIQTDKVEMDNLKLMIDKIALYIDELKSDDINSNKSFNMILSELDSKLSKIEIDRAKASYNPNIDFKLSYSVYDSDYKIDNEQKVLGELSINGLFYKGGYISSAKEENNNLLKASKEKEKITKREDTYTYRNKIIELDSNILEEKLLQDTLEASKSYYQFISKANQHGIKDLTELIDAQEKVVNVEIQILNNRIDSILNFIEINYIRKKIDAEFLNIFK